MITDSIHTNYGFTEQSLGSAFKKIEQALRDLKADKPMRVSAYTTDVNGNMCRTVRTMRPSEIKVKR